MPILYLNNFRGFDDTFLELKNVNFFVGENSTGKTSVLKLLNIISNNQFWYNNADFNKDENGLGYFSEIANITNKNSNYFEIGILGNFNYINYEEESNSAIKLKFTEVNSIPKLSELRIIDRENNIYAVINGNEVEYNYEKIDINKVFEGGKLEKFKLWINENNLNGKPLHTPKYKGLNSSIAFIRDFINRSIEDNTDNFFVEVMPRFLQELILFPPIRNEPNRIYSSYSINFNPAGMHTPYLLKELLINNPTNSKRIKQIFKKFGEDSGLFEGIEIKQLGNEKTSPFELLIILNDKSLKITNVGYGVSQILPLIVEIIARPNDSWFAIQQPEIHLHPKGQAAFGDFIFKSHKEENKNFIIETHSDYLIDRFRLKLHKECKNNPDCKIESQVIFFERNKKGNKLTCIPILPDGTYPEEQPKEFREFFINEMLELLKV